MSVQIVDDVLALARHGLVPVRLHFPIFGQNEVKCSCGNPNCPPGSRGKHPVERAWGKSATADEDIIRERWNAEWNVGIVLGICHGIPANQAIIDIEDDSPEGRDFADDLLSEYPAPSYTSGKSIHRLYRWSDRLPPVANMTINGLEFRFGGKGLETQSVAPPSRHHSGATYKWIEGRSLDDLPIPDLPEHVIEWLNQEFTRGESRRTGSSTVGTSKFRSPMGKIGPGARHHSLLKYANSLWRTMFELKGINGLDDQENIDQVWMWLAGQNALVCDPPKTEAELEAIFRSSQQFMRKEIEDQCEEELNRRLSETQPEEVVEQKDLDVDSYPGWLAKHQIYLRGDPLLGVLDQSPDRIDEWRCKWTMSYIVKGDEETIEIDIPDVATFYTTLTEFEHAGRFARRVQQETGGRMILSKTWTYWDWNTIWNGKKNDSKGKNGITRVLREYLMSVATVKVQQKNSLVDQVEGLLQKMTGPKHLLVDALNKWNSSGTSSFIGRLKFAPGTDQLTKIRLPEDPHTGLWVLEDGIVWLVKFDELSRAYRSAFGGVVGNRHLTESLESLGFEPRRYHRGIAEGRWHVQSVRLEDL